MKIQTIKALLITTLFLIAISSLAQVDLSPKAEISIITCDPGYEDFYAAFGHSAIRVKDSINNIDLAFNYGVFDFDQPNFYLNYTKGNLNYMLAVTRFDLFVAQYKLENRSIYEQILNLDFIEKRAVFNFLAENSLSENRYYSYDYFYNNCATKVRDVFQDVLGQIDFDSTNVEKDFTIRDLVSIYTEHQPWGGFGIDICLGLPMDKKIHYNEYMFLPDYIHEAFENATRIKEGRSQNLVKESKVYFESSIKSSSAIFFTPNKVFWLIFALIAFLTYQDLSKKITNNFFDILLFGSLGIIGLLLLLLWTATNHKAASFNLNLIWASPLYLSVVVMLMLGERPAWLGWFFFMNSIIMLAVLMAWPWIPQRFNSAFIPIVLIIGIRGYYICRKLSFTKM